MCASRTGRSPRIVSLLPSATEILCALGFAEALVGRSHECDRPPHLAALPVLTETRLDAARPSIEIDRQVRTLLENVLSVYRVDADRLRALAPDVIVTQTQCEVCAVSPQDLKDALAEWTGARPRVVALHAVSLEDIWADIARIAGALDAEAEGKALVAGLKSRMAAVSAQARGDSSPTAVSIEWIEPLMTGGNWIPELIAMAGGRDLLGVEGEPSPRISFDELAAADPEVIAVHPCGFDLARTQAEMAPLADHPGWRRLRAAANGRVAVTDGNHYFNRPGPSIAESLEILAEILHPERLDFGHRGRNWRRFAG